VFLLVIQELEKVIDVLILYIASFILHFM